MVESEQPQHIAAVFTEADLDSSLGVSLDTGMIGEVISGTEGSGGDILQQALEEVSQEFHPETVGCSIEAGGTVIDQESVLTDVIPCGVISTSDSSEGVRYLRIINPEALGLGEEQESTYSSYFTESGEALQAFSNIQPYSYTTNEYSQETEGNQETLEEMLAEGQYINDGSEEQTSETLALPSSGLSTEDISNKSVAQINYSQPAMTRLTSVATKPSVNGAVVAKSSTQNTDIKETAPLGSSQNPIRIIQQGNQYKSLQNLSPEQLQQIMQVVQQQQLLRSSQQTGQASILYNPQTNTKIVFRVVYPSELHKSSTSATATDNNTTRTAPVEFGSPVQKRSYQKRKHVFDDDGGGRATPELSKHEKALRKKHRPRTRYGRVSRPPQYMVKDYKHIHPVDYDEDYDDSDGGYSDYKEGSSDEDGGGGKGKRWDNAMLSQLGIGFKQRKHKCDLCEKGYIGLGGLARHYRLNPTHGKISDQGMNGIDTYNSSDSFQSASISSSLPSSSTTRNQRMETSFSEGIASLSSLSTPAQVMAPSDSLTKPAGDTSDASPILEISGSNRVKHVASTSGAEDPGMEMDGKAVAKNMKEEDGGEEENLMDVTPVQPPKRGKRGRPPSHKQAERRKERLEDLVHQCTDEELMEVVMPRLSASINVWEFLLMKAEQKTGRPEPSEMLKEFEDLHRQMSALFHKKLVPISSNQLNKSEERNEGEEKPVTENQTILKSKSTGTIEIFDSDMARCLGLGVGRYEVKDMEPVRQYKLLTSNPAILNQNPSHTTKRTVELVPQEQLISLPLRKRLRLTETVTGNQNSKVCVRSSNGYSVMEYDRNGSSTNSVATPSSELAQNDASTNNRIAMTTTLSDDSVPSTGSLLCNDSVLPAGSLLCKEEDACSNGAPRSFVDTNSNGSSAADSSVSFPSSDLLIHRAEPAADDVPRFADGSAPSILRGTIDVKPLFVLDSSCHESGSRETERASSSSFSNNSSFVTTSNPSSSESFFSSLKPISREGSRLTPIPKSVFVRQPDPAFFVASSNIDLPGIALSAPPSVEDASASETLMVETNGMNRILSEENSDTRFISDQELSDCISNGHLISMAAVPGGEFTEEKMTDGEQLIQDVEMGDYEDQQEIQLEENAQIIQTNDGLIIIRNTDGTIQIHGRPGQQISLETVQALVGLDQDSQLTFEQQT